jgi:hypothetical protein
MLVALVTTAHAQPPASAADEAFRQGRELLKAGKHAEACAQFEKSQRLDPQLGTLFNIAQCSAQIGRLATAASAYRELVARDSNQTRKDTAERELAGLAARIPKLVVRVADPPAGLKLSLDSKAGTRTLAANLTTEVDLGDYQLVANARGYAESISKVKVSEEGKTVTVEVALEPLAETSSSSATEPPPRSKRKLVGLGIAATGGAVLIGGVVVGSLARSAWNDAKAVCGGTTCATPEDVDRANALGDKARSKATLSTALAIGGGVLAAAGVVLWVTAPSGVQITPTATDGGGGVTFAGTF